MAPLCQYFPSFSLLSKASALRSDFHKQSQSSKFRTRELRSSLDGYASRLVSWFQSGGLGLPLKAAQKPGIRDERPEGTSNLAGGYVDRTGVAGDFSHGPRQLHRRARLAHEPQCSAAQTQTQEIKSTVPLAIANPEPESEQSMKPQA